MCSCSDKEPLENNQNQTFNNGGVADYSSDKISNNDCGESILESFLSKIGANWHYLPNGISNYHSYDFEYVSIENLDGIECYKWTIPIVAYWAGDQIKEQEGINVYIETGDNPSMYFEPISKGIQDILGFRYTCIWENNDLYIKYGDDKYYGLDADYISAVRQYLKESKYFEYYNSMIGTNNEEYFNFGYFEHHEYHCYGINYEWEVERTADIPQLTPPVEDKYNNLALIVIKTYGGSSAAAFWQGYIWFDGEHYYILNLSGGPWGEGYYSNTYLEPVMLDY